MRAIEPPADPAAKRPGETHAFSVVRGSCASSEAMLLTCCRSVSVCIGPCAFLGESDGFAFSASLTVLHAVLSGSSDTAHRTPLKICGHPATGVPPHRNALPHECILRIVAYLAVHKVYVSFASLLRPLSPLPSHAPTHTRIHSLSGPAREGARTGVALMSSRVPLTERVAATLKRHAEERCHFDERHAKELHELTDSGMSADDCEAVRPAIPSLVQLLKLSGGASVAASTLLRLSDTSDTARDAIREAGAIPLLVALLHAGAESEAAENAAGALGSLADDNRTNQDAIREAGAIPPLVALLHAGAESDAAKIAACALWILARYNRTNQDAIREAGAIPPLVALLHAGAESEAAESAAGALWILAGNNRTNRDAIREAGAIPPLVALLHAGAESEAAENAAGALGNLAYNNPTNQGAIREAGAIPLLVALLHAGAESEAAKIAACALRNLACNNPANKDAIREAGAIPLFVALLHAGAESKAARYAAQTLCVLALNPTCSDAILAAVANAAAPLHAFSELQRKLRSVATARLHRAEAGETVVALEAALATAAAVGAADEAVTERVRSRLDELQTAAARRARRESVGLNVPLPADFICPITYDKMKDPVVASDGHSYERSAIEEILRGPHPLSPLTRATLGTALVPNLNLRRRIEDHEAELDRMAEQMAARLATAVAEAESAANVKEAAAKAAAEAKEAAANAEIEALRKQLADAKKRVRTEDDLTEEPWEEQDPPAPKRRAPSSRHSTGSGAGGSA